MKSKKLGIVLIASLCAASLSLAQPGARMHPPKRHNEQGRTDAGRVPHPWANPAHPFHWVWLSGQTSNTPRHGDDDQPAGGVGGVGGSDSPANPCPSGDC